MNTLFKVAGALTATATMLVFTASSTFASVTVAGNGAFSKNEVSVSNENSTSVNQSNFSSVTNDVNTSNNTGGNSASFNTGGSNSINTGSASSNVDISVGGNTNTAVLNSCGCTNFGDVTIWGNGARSRNNVDVFNKMSTRINQTNSQFVNNRVNVRNNTGNNNENFNTGGAFNKGKPFNKGFLGNNGSNDIQTGNANSQVRINVDGSRNFLSN